MKTIKTLMVGVFAVVFLTSAALAADKTCCEKAVAEGKECKHKCCLSAHKDGKSCERCNPNKQDAKLLKKSEKKADKK